MLYSEIPNAVRNATWIKVDRIDTDDGHTVILTEAKVGGLGMAIRSVRWTNGDDISYNPYLILMDQNSVAVGEKNFKTFTAAKVVCQQYLIKALREGMVDDSPPSIVMSEDDLHQIRSMAVF